MATKMAEKGGKNVFAFRYVFHMKLERLITRAMNRWNAPNPVLLAEAPFQGVMHTSDLYFLFDGTLHSCIAHTCLTFSRYNIRSKCWLYISFLQFCM